jgi:uncharacterized protein YxeA
MKGIFIMFVGILIIGCSIMQPNNTENNDRTISYYIITTGNAYLSYWDENRVSKTINNTITPWSYTFQSKKGEYVYVGGFDLANNSIYIKITVDGKIWKSTNGTTNAISLGGALL